MVRIEEISDIVDAPLLGRQSVEQAFLHMMQAVEPAAGESS